MKQSAVHLARGRYISDANNTAAVYLLYKFAMHYYLTTIHTNQYHSKKTLHGKA